MQVRDDASVCDIQIPHGNPEPCYADHEVGQMIARTGRRIVRIDGATLTLRYLDESDLLRAIAMRVAGDRLDGEMVPPYGMIEGGLQSAPVTGRRLPR